MHHKALSRRGGLARSEAKTRANRLKASSFWAEVRAGLRPAPKRPKVPPTADEVARLMVDYCRANGISRLELFGSVARGDARRGSDVDMLVTFSSEPGLRFVLMEEEVAEVLGASVHILTRISVEKMTNPYRRESILADAREIWRDG